MKKALGAVLVAVILVGLPDRAWTDNEIPVAFRYSDARAQKVEVAGEFSNWRTIPLSKQDAENWSTTLHLKPGIYGYKFVVDGEWVFDPRNPARKFVNDIENSAINVGNVPAPKPADQPGAIRFQYHDPNAKTVHLAGDFNRWLDNENGKVTGKSEWLMQKDAQGMWTYSLVLPPGRHQFKFVIDGGARWEKAPGFPTQDDNSVIEVKADAGATTAPPAGQEGNVTFVFAAPDARAVFVAGEFNQWNDKSHPLQKDAAGIWSTTLSLKPGRYQYKFVVDGNWQTDPTAVETVDDGLGGKNSVKIVP